MNHLPTTQVADNGMVVAPHHAAAEAGLDVLKAGGNAIEAAIATAASLSVHYPHMTGIGGDAFWLVYDPQEGVSFIEASGHSGYEVTPELYQGVESIPFRGKLAANTVAGAVSAWDQAYRKSQKDWQGCLSSAALMAEAVESASRGIEVTPSLAETLLDKATELQADPFFAEVYYPQGKVPEAGETLLQEKLGKTLQSLGDNGFDDFYRGDIAKSICNDFEIRDGFITHEDLRQHQAEFKPHLEIDTKHAKLFNASAPTQGVASLMILGLFDRWVEKLPEKDSVNYVHLLVEATKIAFEHRDRMDTSASAEELQAWLDPEYLDELSARIDFDKAQPWGEKTEPGDTTWFGAMDSQGRVVSAIQSIYHEFGSGLMLPETGIVWQNRGCSFSLDPNHVRSIAPHKKPFHTLNPAIALFKDGRVMAYGTMGGDGQPQTQAAVFSRYAYYAEDLQTSINQPRWLLGRTWGNSSESLKLEKRFPREYATELKQKGHDFEWLEALDASVGHAGALVRHPSSKIEGAYDPRSDGKAAGF
ncbi:gamma-glutamyltransferase family protein [Thiomicrorhabdus sp. ZW0627]|uniref:gamma-glutamyltransferase family protein n=1 Tax=Thiomicrorhabdus sp. ZW0627 TaxID=3039774 RepID=UPI002436B6DF|nr:gamma-glutamyltransferase family protein [Thiomicrorhabdus sp. ZW0627]MDG6774874.1 gamma-glutamyltransferase family protein [Thiomicrorhabdus sp. ZW0627]